MGGSSTKLKVARGMGALTLDDDGRTHLHEKDVVFSELKELRTTRSNFSEAEKTAEGREEEDRVERGSKRPRRRVFFSFSGA